MHSVCSDCPRNSRTQMSSYTYSGISGRVCANNSVSLCISAFLLLLLLFFIFLSHPFLERERRVAGGGTSPQITTPTRVPQLVNALTPQFSRSSSAPTRTAPDALREDGFSHPVFPPLALQRVTSAPHRLALAPVTSSPLRCSVREKKKKKKKKLPAGRGRGTVNRAQLSSRLHTTVVTADKVAKGGGDREMTAVMDVT